MKTSTLHRLVVVSAVASVFSVPQTGFSQTNFTAENFNTNAGYVRNYGIISDQQPAGIRWQGNDPYNPTTGFGETDLIGYALGYTPPPLANSSLLQGGSGAAGGILPGTNNVSIWRSFNAYSNYAVVSFEAEWSIIGSTPLAAPYTNSDTFAFDLRNANNSASLLKLQFTPGINVQTNSYTLQAVVNGVAGAPLLDMGYGSLFTTQTDITGSTYSISITRLDPSTRNVITNYSNWWSGSLSTGLTSDDFATIALDWTLTSGNNEDPGSNYIIVNNFAAVPEPSTYALLALAVFALLGIAFRRGRA